MADRIGSRQIVLNLLRGRASVSRPQIAASLSVSLPTAGALVKELLAQRLVVETECERRGGGRPAQLIRMNPDYAHAIGLSVSRDAIQAVVVDLAGRSVWQAAPAAPPPSCDQVIELVAAQVAAAVSRENHAPIGGVGVGICGVVEHGRGLARSFPQKPDWRDVPLADLLAKRFDLPVIVSNQVQAATLAELHYGQGRQFDDLLYLHVGRGIGLGLVSQGRLIRGARGHAGEIGHVTIDPAGPECYCGRHGCLEALAAPWAISRDAAQAIARGEPTALAGAAGLDGGPSIEAIATAAADGDELAGRLLAEAGRRTGEAAANVANVLNPQAMVLGGLAAGGPEQFVDALTDAFGSHLLADLADQTTVCVSEVGEGGCAIGAATAVFDHLLSQPMLPRLGARRKRRGPMH